ncbi:hypothetical protein HNR23_003401 [Nocardiopsis mwathae]|uniref:Uncharacterized protein n=1 Tax=Nocardiopsis mwathae TaxID=1472723 RepID=A0A7W9YHS1_9ACTN|nr:hypothetical protein [Nocardiopsis mwathae]MBB6173341.1 hypothetical protein [Nocardiopsis mwathae]
MNTIVQQTEQTTVRLGCRVRNPHHRRSARVRPYVHRMTTGEAV